MDQVGAALCAEITVVPTSSEGHQAGKRGTTHGQSVSSDEGGGAIVPTLSVASDSTLVEIACRDQLEVTLLNDLHDAVFNS
jgi:hypothetical protein